MARERTARYDRPQPWRAYFVKVPYRILAHEAYLTLRPSAQLIFIDFRRHMDRHTDFGMEPIPHGGIPYAYGHCAHICHRNTFRMAMRDLTARGFLIDTGQLDIDGETAYYVPSKDWRAWRAPKTDARKLAELKQRILRREHLDQSDRCTFLVQPPRKILDNPLLKFWAPTPTPLHKNRAALPIGSEIEKSERAHARAKQTEYQSDTPHNIEWLEQRKAALTKNPQHHNQ